MFRRILVVLWGMLLCSPLIGEVTSNLSHPKIVIVDTDADVDDLTAILYLLKSPRANVKGIITSGDGVSRWEYGANNISNLMELIGRSHVTVAFGARKSLSPAGNVPKEWREEADQVLGIKLPYNPNRPVRTKGVDVMIELIKQNPVKTNILCMGPLTNVAIALNKDPDIKENIERIYMMGGALLLPGNIEGRPQGYRNKVAEYNIFLDAQAASDVLNSGVPITMVPLDATEHVPITKTFYEKLLKDRKTPSANFVYEVLRPYQSKRIPTYFSDPLAAVIMTHPEIASYRNLNLAINLRKGPEYGRVIMTKQGPTVQVVTAIDADAFYNLFLKTLNLPTTIKQNPNESK